MTQEEKPRKIDEIKKIIKKTEEIARAGEGLEHYRAEIANESIGTLKKRAYEIAKIDNPNYARSEEEMTDEEIQNFVRKGDAMDREVIGRKFYENLNEIVNKEILDEGLEKLLGEKEVAKDILENASEDGRKAIAQYAQLRQFEKEFKIYAESGRASEETGKKIMEYAQEGAAKDAVERMKKLGYKNKRTLEMTESLARASVRMGGYSEDQIKAYALKSLKEELDEAREKLSDADKAYKATRESIIKLANSRSPEDFKKALSYTLAAAA